MKSLSLEEFSQASDRFDRLVMQSPDVDLFCSSSSWVLPAAEALMPGRDPWIWEGPEGFVAMMRGMHPDGWHYLEPLESMWGLASPLISPEPAVLVAAFTQLARRYEADWELLLIGGVVQGSVAYDSLIKSMGSRYRLRLGRATQRHCASLEGGLEGFLSRRSRKFRANLRRDQRTAAQAGVVFEQADGPELDPAALYERILRVERQSWKGMRGVGIDQGQMRDFYAQMVRQLLPIGALRVLFARLGDQDVSYILGGVLGDTFRGLQFSYVHQHRDLALGNLSQVAMIERLAGEGVVYYDLGSDIEYKARWGEGGMRTVTLVVYR